MSGWIKQLVGRKDSSNNNNNNQQNNNNNDLISQSQRKKQISSVSQENLDKFKGLWTLYVNMHSEHDKSVQLTKILPQFVSTYERSDIKDISQT